MRRYISTFIACIALAGSGPAMAACEFDIEVNDTLQFSTKQMQAEASCEKITVSLRHTGNLPVEAMGHNWVLSETADYQAAAMEGMNAGLENDYLVPADERVIAATKMIGGGDSTSVTFSVAELAPGKYTFFCSFPGHWSSMQGVFELI